MGKNHVQQIALRYRKFLSLLNQHTKNDYEPKIVLVTKNQPIELIMDLLEQIDSPILGENRIQEAIPKIEMTLNKPIEWHFIGHLQRNKVKHALGKFSLIQSVASLSLAKEIEKRAATKEISVNCLLQIDICEDGSKFGFLPNQFFLLDLFQELNSMEHIQIQGLMTIAPFIPAEETRPYFKRMRSLFNVLSEECSSLENINMNILSMGMSNDYIVALEEGSTMIRIGSAIFEESVPVPHT